MVTRTRTAPVKRVLASALTGALIAGGVVLGATSAANAAPTPVSAGTGSLSWGIKESLRNYVGNQTAALAAQGGAAPIGTRLVPSGGATFDPASTPIPAQNSTQEKLPYLFPVSGGTVTDANNLSVSLGGAVQLWFPSHNFDIHFSDLKVVVANGVATIVGDVSFADVAWTDNAWVVGTPTVGDDIVVATVDTATVNVDGAANTVSVAGTGVKFTKAAADVFTNPVTGSIYPEGTPVDNFTVTASTQAPAANPTIVLSKSAGLNPAGDTVHVTGTGFGTNVNGAYPPVSGVPAGFYVAFGKYADPWKPSAGAPSANRKNGAGGSGLWWVVPQVTYDQVKSVYGPTGTTPDAATFSQFVVLQSDGSFQLDLTVAAVQGSITATTPGAYGVYTYGAGGRAAAGLETATPIAFASANDVNVTVPAWVDQPSGSFGWAFASQTPASLGTATQEGANFVATGALTEIVVTDDRQGGSAPYSWSVSGQVGAFTAGSNTFAGSLLGWTPKKVEGGASVGAGAAVTSTQLGGVGLGASSVLGSSSAAASARLGADLKLVIPGTTPAGDYTAKLTITAVS